MTSPAHSLLNQALEGLRGAIAQNPDPSDDPGYDDLPEEVPDDERPILSRERMAEMARDWDFRMEITHPEIDVMLTEAREFLCAWAHRDRPRWLTLLGPSGTGKTHIACRIADYWATVHGSRNGTLSQHWPSLYLGMVQVKSYASVTRWNDVPRLVMDEITTGSRADFVDENKALQAALLPRAEVLGRRPRWTVLTSNMSLDEIASQVDARLASRMHGENHLVEICDAPDYRYILAERR